MSESFQEVLPLKEDAKPLKCNARDRDGSICRNYVTRGMTKCHKHGGASLRGIASPRFIHGRYSKYLPKHLAEIYALALNDPNLLQLKDDIALMDARLGEMFGKLDRGESVAAWSQVTRSFKKFLNARALSLEAVEDLAVTELQTAIEKGMGDYESWQEIHATIEQRRKLVQDEHRVQINLKQMITAEKAMTLLAVVVDSMKRSVNLHCRDKQQAEKILMSVSQDLFKITGINTVEPRFALQDAITNGK
ncbi:MAG: hypothetical protein Q7K03_08415 [Dehalococcoidia bacterium]|nr:hypothetical protein [Dehalococcoidia bacterium]